MFRTIWALLVGMDQKLNTLGKSVVIVGENTQVLQKDLIALHSAVVDQLNAIHKDLAAAQKITFDLLLKIQAELTPPVAVALELTTTGTTKGANGMLQVKDDGSVVLSLVAKDAKGNAGASLDGVPAWKSSDESIMTLNVAADGMTAVGVLSGKLGQVAVHVEAASGGASLAADSEMIEVDPGAASVLAVEVAAAPAPIAPSGPSA